MVDVVDALTVRGTSAREADEAGTQVGDGLCQVLAEAVGTSFEGLTREERDEIYVKTARLERFQYQFCPRGRSGGGERSLLLLPCSRSLHRCRGQHLAVFDERHLHASVAAGEEAQVVLLSLSEGHAVPSAVDEACAGLGGDE